jgi:hypothetical protein
MVASVGRMVELLRPGPAAGKKAPLFQQKAEFCCGCKCGCKGVWERLRVGLGRVREGCASRALNP